MANRLIIVGDDQQISPQAVGINKDSVEVLMKEYLYDFDHADSFDAENSLFVSVSSIQTKQCSAGRPRLALHWVPLTIV